MPKIYIDRDVNSEYSATDLYDDHYSADLVEAEMSNKEWLAANKTIRDYWDLQDKLHELFEAGKSLRGDKNKPE